MKIDTLAITATITREVDSDEYNQLVVLFKSGEKVEGLADQFVWMPFIVESMIKKGNAATFNLRMMVRKKR